MTTRSSTGVVVLSALMVSASAHAADPRYVLSDSTYRLTSEFGRDTLLIREFVFESPFLAAQIDSSTGTLLVAMGKWIQDESSPNTPSILRDEGRGYRTVAYDLHERRVIWSHDSRKGLPIAAAARRALFQRGDKGIELIRLIDGSKLAEIGGAPFVWQDGVALRVTDGAICRWDLEDARDLWEAGREVGGPVDDVVRDDSVAYLVAEGLQKVDLQQGSQWSYTMRASRGRLYGVEGGGTVQMPGLGGGERAVNMNARPLLDGPDIYFAADTVVVRLDSGTGLVRWRRRLQRPRAFSLKQRALGTPMTEQFLGRLLLRDAGPNIAVVSLGWSSGAKGFGRPPGSHTPGRVPVGESWIADPPSLALLAKSDGLVLARIQVPGVQFLNDAWSTAYGHYLVTSDRVILMDDSLTVRATFRAPSHLEPLGGFIDVGNLVVVTTRGGVAALSPDSLQIVWSKACGQILALETHVDWAGARYVVTTKGLLRLDPGAGRRPSAYYPLPGTWGEFRHNGVMMGGGVTLRLVVRPEPSLRRPVD